MDSATADDHDQPAEPDSAPPTDTMSTTLTTSQPPKDNAALHEAMRVVSKLPFSWLRTVLPQLPRRQGRAWLFQLDDGVLLKQCWSTRSSESRAMQYVREHAPSVPVPEVYHSDFSNPREGRIFMEEVPGETLEKVWPTLVPSQKERACRDIWDIIVALRRIPRPWNIPSGKCLYTTIDGSPLYPEGRLTGNSSLPLDENLHNTDDALRNFIIQRYRENHGPDEEVKHNFPHSETAVFTHGDIHPRNIMASEDGRVTSLLDFEYAGFMPDYWEDIGMFIQVWEEDQDWADTMMRTKPSDWDFDATRALCRKAKRVLHW